MLRDNKNTLGAAPEPESKVPSGYLRAGKRKIKAKNISAMLKMILRVEFIYFPNVNTHYLPGISIHYFSNRIPCKSERRNPATTIAFIILCLFL